MIIRNSMLSPPPFPLTHPLYEKFDCWLHTVCHFPCNHKKVLYLSFHKNDPPSPPRRGGGGGIRIPSRRSRSGPDRGSAGPDRPKPDRESAGPGSAGTAAPGTGNVPPPPGGGGGTHRWSKMKKYSLYKTDKHSGGFGGTFPT